MTRKTNILLPCKLMNLLDACMESERLQAKNIAGLNTCSEGSALKQSHSYVFDAEEEED